MGIPDFQKLDIWEDFLTGRAHTYIYDDNKSTTWYISE